LSHFDSHIFGFCILLILLITADPIVTEYIMILASWRCGYQLLHPDVGDDDAYVDTNNNTNTNTSSHTTTTTTTITTTTTTTTITTTSADTNTNTNTNTNRDEHPTHPLQGGSVSTNHVVRYNVFGGVHALFGPLFRTSCARGTSNASSTKPKP
jgi:hypothetical protein